MTVTGFFSGTVGTEGAWAAEAVGSWGSVDPFGGLRGVGDLDLLGESEVDMPGVRTRTVQINPRPRLI